MEKLQVPAFHTKEENLVCLTTWSSQYVHKLQSYLRDVKSTATHKWRKPQKNDRDQNGCNKMQPKSLVARAEQCNLLKIPQFLIPASDFKDELDRYFCANDNRSLPSKVLLTTVVHICLIIQVSLFSARFLGKNLCCLKRF